MEQNKPTSHSAFPANSDSFLELSKRINSIRFLLIVLVVCIHSNPLNLLVTNHTTAIPIGTKFVIVSISSIISALAVPLFFLISGYLLYAKENKFVPVLKKKSKTLLLPYLIWCSFAALMYFVGQSFDFSQSYFTKYIIRDFELVDWVLAFTGGLHQPSGYQAIQAVPIANPLWFIRDLFILSLLFLVIKKIIDKFPFCAIITMFILWISVPTVFILSTEALLFFSLGYYVVKYSLYYKKVDTIKNMDIAILYVATIIIENFFMYKVSIIHNINIVIGIIVFIKSSKYLISRPKLYYTLLKLNVYTFFVYAFHEAIASSTRKIFIKILPTNDCWLILQFFLVAIIGVIVSLTVAMFLKKYFPKVYAILTGGRS